jgi:hypothetical protein
LHPARDQPTRTPAEQKGIAQLRKSWGTIGRTDFQDVLRDTTAPTLDEGRVYGRLVGLSWAGHKLGPEAAAT